MTTEQPKATASESDALQKIHIGNLAVASSEEGVRALFAEHGVVSSFERPTIEATKAPAGFAYVQMNRPDAARAIAALNGHELDGQALRVTEARAPRA